MPTTCFMTEFRVTHSEPNPNCTGHGDGKPCMDEKGDIVRLDSGEVIVANAYNIRHAPPGAMYWWNLQETTRPTGPDDWDHPNLRRPSPDAKRQPSDIFADGPHLVVVLPNGHPWNIDSRASNCSMPWDYAHRCWVRHGEPPGITVDKAALTCTAGGGSTEERAGGPPK